MTGSNKLTTKDYRKTTLRSYFLQNGFNYSNYQGLGYSLVMYPAFKKLYGNDKAKLSDVLSENIEFYNTNPNLLPFITSIHLAMADNGMEYKETRGIKMALMGPLAGIGDSLSQFCIAPLFSTIFASLAMNNIAMAPVFFLLAENLTLLMIKFGMGAYGQRLGTSMIDKLSAKMSLISNAASMVGVTVIAGLAATFVKMKVTLTYASSQKAAKGATTSTVDIQALLDKVAPALLPVLYTLLMYYLIKKHGWTTYKLVILTVVIGVALSALHILGA
ncbi:PTS system mannose/fructose/sorbose family transporter subunit IID [Lacticaseibacillus daqingensis]|uniref:PTS system mannose/fructose/sorbose family transporter subunit IID n=1 Tax=Lacticaseibacillus daqingensis TaxID=2486014 RepID=UPI000F770A84|nr:PTS system mannose/fructose/sorbose family transporter subunit IID [Lacticaseibacillus daqingensis]